MCIPEIFGISYHLLNAEPRLDQLTKVVTSRSARDTELIGADIIKPRNEGILMINEIVGT